MRLGRMIRNFKRQANGWLIASLAGAAVILLPILFVLSGLFQPANDNWATIRQYMLSDYIVGTVKIVGFTGVLATVLGLVLAWLVVGYDFPLRRFFRWGLVLPLAMPPYIMAYTYSTMTSYTGVIQATLRNHFNIMLPPGTIEVMSGRGAVFVLTLCLFPYVFMIATAFLERQSASYIENARLLGRKGISLFCRVVLPISRPAVIAGSMLVVFEVISDYGVVSYFGVQTLSTAIFQTWFGMYDVDSAIRLASWLMVVVIGIYVLERFLRRNRRFHTTTSQTKPMKPQRLKRAPAIAAAALCLIVFMLAFLLPLLQIIVWTTWTYEKVWRSNFLDLMANTLTGALIAACAVVLLAILAARTARTVDSTIGYTLSRLMTAGYAVPGAVIAVGVLALFIRLDEWLSPVYVMMGKEEGVLVLSLSLFMLITGYIVRFLASGYNAMETGYDKIPKAYSEASRTLGKSSAATFFRVELPLLKGSLLSAFILTFVEVVKELPLTLLLRPFNFDTLATRTYQYAVDERIFEAALPSLMLIGISLVSVMFIWNYRIKER